MMNYYLIRFKHTGWCQGPEEMVETVLVKALSYNDARNIIKDKYTNARNFGNLTLA